MSFLYHLGCLYDKRLRHDEAEQAWLLNLAAQKEVWEEIHEMIFRVVRFSERLSSPYRNLRYRPSIGNILQD